MCHFNEQTYELIICTPFDNVKLFPQVKLVPFPKENETSNKVAQSEKIDPASSGDEYNA